MPRNAITVIAEVGLMHEGSLGNARRFVDVAAECGADVVKFQTHIAEAETLRDAPSPPYFQGESRFSYFQRTAFSPSQWKSLKRYCERRGIRFLSSAFSIEAVELLRSLGMEMYKIPSGEVTNVPYLERIAAIGKPVLLSSGMSSWKELDRAVAVFKKRRVPLTVFQCTSLYPCPDEKVGLNVLAEIRKRYGCPAGLSDHTITNYASYAAAALGAAAIEKHLTLSRKLYGSDAKHSLEPAAFADLVSGVRAIERMQAHPVNKNDLRDVRAMKGIFEKSLVTNVAIPKGVIIRNGMIGAKKPGGGLPAAEFGRILGRRARRFLPADRLLRRSDVA